MSLVYLNGEYLRPEEAKLSVRDRGLAYGDGVFTTIRVSDGSPMLLSWHLERLGRDAAEIYIDPPEAGDLASVCRGLISRLELGDGVLKIIVTRGAGGRGPSIRSADEPTVIATASGSPAMRPPLKVLTVPDTRGPLAAHKTLNYLPNVLALRKAESAGCDEALFSGERGLLEGTVSNLVGLSGGELLTPPLDGKTLPGVARRALLESGVVREGALPTGSDGPLYCVNSVRGVEAVAKIDGRQLAQDEDMRDALEGALEEQTRLAASG